MGRVVVLYLCPLRVKAPVGRGLQSVSQIYSFMRRAGRRPMNLHCVLDSPQLNGYRARARFNQPGKSERTDRLRYRPFIGKRNCNAVRQTGASGNWYVKARRELSECPYDAKVLFKLGTDTNEQDVAVGFVKF